MQPASHEKTGNQGQDQPTGNFRARCINRKNEHTSQAKHKLLTNA